LPEELEQATTIDDAMRLQTFRKLTLSLAKPALMAVALSTFINIWNAFLFAFVFLS
jgi:multiple sugar transport system permease protein